MTITITAREALDKGIWEEVCEMKGWNVWCINEGLMRSDERISFSEEEAKKLGLNTVEYCYACAGYGGCPGSDFGDHGWHPCFRCGTTGILPAGTAERDAALAAEMSIPPAWYERGEADWMQDD